MAKLGKNESVQIETLVKFVKFQNEALKTLQNLRKGEQ